MFELIGVQPDAQAVRLRGTKDPPCILNGKHARFAEDVAVLAQCTDCRQHLLNHEREVLRAAAAVFIRRFVRAKKRGYGAKRLDLRDHPQKFSFIVARKAVARFSFDRCRAATEEPLRSEERRGGKEW